MLEEDFLEAVIKGDTQRVVLLLGQLSSLHQDINQQPNRNGRNALHLAVEAVQVDVASILLLSELFDCNYPDSAGYTALQIAAAEGHVELVKLIIKAGADVNRADKVHGNTAIHEASWKGFSQTVAILAKAKANLDIRNWGGFTALHLACQNGHNQSCRELLLASCDPDVQNNYGDTPLHTSARYGHAGVMRILISAKCRISDQNKNGDTALHIAAAMGRRKLTRILLEANCDKELLNRQEERAEDIAIRKSLTSILEILRSPPTVKNEVVLTNNDITTTKNKEPKKKTKHKVQFEDIKYVIPSGDSNVIPWSPYGCHYYPDSSEFPEPNIDSLPNEPLRKGEQYFLDLAGNIRKGPVGVGYTCYCTPFFRDVESRMERKTKRLKKRIEKAEENLNQRLQCVEKRLQMRSSNECSDNSKQQDKTKEKYVLDDNGNNVPSKSSDDDIKERLKMCSINEKEKYKKYTELKAIHQRFCYEKNCADNLYFLKDDNFFRDTRELRKYQEERENNLWVKGDKNVESSEDDEPIAYDSGYSTKICSNSQGPSPSLSGRLDTQAEAGKNIPDNIESSYIAQSASIV